jgi:DNA-binding IclR family transcriptional regulator
VSTVRRAPAGAPDPVVGPLEGSPGAPAVAAVVAAVASSGRNGVRSVASALDVLDCFTWSAELGVTEIANRLGCSKSTAHRFLTTLTDKRLVERIPESGRYRLGLHLYELGQIAVSRFDLRAAALPVLEQLRAATNQTVHASVADGPDVLYVERFETWQGRPFSSRVGRRMPVHCTSSGKVLAAWDESVARARLAAGLPRRTPRTITDPARFVAELEEVRRRGYGVNMEEAEVGLSSVSAPVVSPNGRVLAAISVAGPTDVILGDGGQRVVRLVREAATGLGARIRQGQGSGGGR